MTYKIFTLFGNSYVHIITRTLRGTEVSGRNRMTGPMVLSGFLLEEDDMYFYLGQTEEEISDAILKTEVVRIYTPVEDLMNEIFGDIETPSSDQMS